MDTHTYIHTHTYVHTHRTTTVTLAAHARRGLIMQTSTTVSTEYSLESTVIQSWKYVGDHDVWLDNLPIQRAN